MVGKAKTAPEFYDFSLLNTATQKQVNYINLFQRYQSQLTQVPIPLLQV